MYVSLTLGFQVLFSFSQDRKNQCLLAKLFDFRDGYESTTDVDVTIHTNMFPYSQLPTLNFSGSCSFEMYALHRDVLRPADRKEICGFISLHLGTFWCSFPLTIYEGEKSCPNISLLLFTRRVAFGRCHIRIDDLRLFGRLSSQTNIANLNLPPLTTITVPCPYHRFPPPRFALCAKSNALRLNILLYQATLRSSHLPTENLSSCSAAFPELSEGECPQGRKRGTHFCPHR